MKTSNEKKDTRQLTPWRLRKGLEHWPNNCVNLLSGAK